VLRVGAGMRASDALKKSTTTFIHIRERDTARATLSPPCPSPFLPRVLSLSVFRNTHTHTTHTHTHTHNRSAAVSAEWRECSGNKTSARWQCGREHAPHADSRPHLCPGVSLSVYLSVSVSVSMCVCLCLRLCLCLCLCVLM